MWRRGRPRRQRKHKHLLAVRAVCVNAARVLPPLARGMSGADVCADNWLPTSADDDDECVHSALMSHTHTRSRSACSTSHGHVNYGKMVGNHHRVCVRVCYGERHTLSTPFAAIVDGRRHHPRRPRSFCQPLSDSWAVAAPTLAVLALADSLIAVVYDRHVCVCLP